ncbi:MAG: SDR family oxidoreductase [Rhodococcus sp. (in: high G+C Gram-positive bacteria)]
MERDLYPLIGRTVVVTGASRRAGIGHAIACRAASYGANLVVHHFAPHDDQQPWGGDDVAAVLDSVRGDLVPSARMIDVHADLTDPDAPEQLLDAATAEFGLIDALVCNQALSGSDGALGDLTAENLDRHWAVNTRASILAAQAFADRHHPGTQGAIVFMTSGQQRGPMPGELAYAAAKAGLAGVTPTIADQLADSGIRVNCVNPGPIDTGYMTDEHKMELVRRFPFGRIGNPNDAARLVVWLCTDDASWITGQVMDSEGGFRR